MPLTGPIPACLLPQLRATGTCLCTCWNRTPPDRQNQLETRSKRFVTRDGLMDLWGLLGAVSRAEELSHTCLHKCNFFVYVCACVHAFVYTCEPSCVSTRGRTSTHTAHRERSKVKEQLPALSFTEHTGKGPRTTFSSLPPF